MAAAKKTASLQKLVDARRATGHHTSAHEAQALPKAAKSLPKASKPAETVSKPAESVTKGRGRPKSEETLAREAKRAAEISAGLRRPGQRGPAKAPKAEAAKPVDEPKSKGGRPPKPDSRRALREARKAERVEKGIELKPGPAPNPDAKRRQSRAKPKALPSKVVSDGRIQPKDLGDKAKLETKRGKTNVEVRRFGSSVVKLQSRAGKTPGGKEYEATRSSTAAPGADSFKPTSVHVLFKDSDGATGYKFRRRDPNDRAKDVTEGSITRGGQTRESYEPRRGAGNYGSASFWKGMSLEGKPISQAPIESGPTESSVGKIRRVDPTHPGRGKAHKGAQYITKKGKSNGR